MKTTFLWILIGSLLIGCNTTEKPNTDTVEGTEQLSSTSKELKLVEKVTYAPDSSKTVYQVNQNTNQKHGKYQEFDVAGTLRIERNYEADLATGSEKMYSEAGKLRSKFLLNAGKYDGAFQYYYEDGTLKQEGVYEKDKMVGELKTYYANGNMKEKIMLVDGKTQGPFVEYNENGTLKTEGNYNYRQEQEALEMGLLKEYDGEGELMTKKVCRDGVCCTIWTKAGGAVSAKNSLCESIIEAYNANPENQETNSTVQ